MLHMQHESVRALSVVHGKPHEFDAVHWEREPTRDPSQEGNRQDADQRLLPSCEGSRAGWFIERHLFVYVTALGP